MCVCTRTSVPCAGLRHFFLDTIVPQNQQCAPEAVDRLLEARGCQDVPQYATILNSGDPAHDAGALFRSRPSQPRRHAVPPQLRDTAQLRARVLPFLPQVKRRSSSSPRTLASHPPSSGGTPAATPTPCDARRVSPPSSLASSRLGRPASCRMRRASLCTSSMRIATSVCCCARAPPPAASTAHSGRAPSSCGSSAHWPQQRAEAAA